MTKPNSSEIIQHPTQPTSHLLTYSNGSPAKSDQIDETTQTLWPLGHFLKYNFYELITIKINSLPLIQTLYLVLAQKMSW